MVVIDYFRAVAMACGAFIGSLAMAGPLNAETLGGVALAQKNNCLSCHNVDRKVVGPGLIDIAKRYGDSAESVDYLARSIMEGSQGKWGPVPMPRQVQVSPRDANALASWILSLQDEAQLDP